MSAPENDQFTMQASYREFVGLVQLHEIGTGYQIAQVEEVETYAQRYVSSRQHTKVIGFMPEVIS